MNLTRNLKLRLTEDLTTDAKYNLERIDLLGNITSIENTEELLIRSLEAITIEPSSLALGGQGGGTINLGSASEPIDLVQIFSTSTIVEGSMTINDNLNTDNIRLYNNVETDSTYVQLKAEAGITSSYDIIFPNAQGTASQVLSNDGNGNLSWASIATDSLPSGNIKIGNATGDSESVDTTSVGDITGSTTGGLEIKDNVIEDVNISATAEISRSKIASDTPFSVAYNDGSGNLSNIPATAGQILIGAGTQWVKQDASILTLGLQDSSEKGAANGYASLDATSKVPASQLPSFVDDVVEAADFASLPVTGETGKIYVTLNDNKTFRWSGSAYVNIGSGAVETVNTQTGNIVLDTDDINEGSSNLYYTDTRFDARLATKVLNDLADVGISSPTDGQVLSYNGSNFINDNIVRSSDTFVGDGSTTVFTLSQTPSTSVVVDVSVEGVVQIPNTYTVTGNQITFSEAPPAPTVALTPNILVKAFTSLSVVGLVTQLNDLTDVDTTTTAPVIGDTLVYDGSSFVPQAASSGGSGPTLVMSIRQQANQGDVANTTSGFVRYSQLLSEDYNDPNGYYVTTGGVSVINLPEGKYFIQGRHRIYTSGTTTSFQMNNSAGAAAGTPEEVVYQQDSGTTSGSGTHTFGFILDVPAAGIGFSITYSNNGAGYNQRADNIYNHIKIYEY